MDGNQYVLLCLGTINATLSIMIVIGDSPMLILMMDGNVNSGLDNDILIIKTLLRREEHGAWESDSRYRVWALAIILHSS